MTEQRGHSYSAFGPQEPKGFEKIREQYHQSRHRTEKLETRIAMSDAGLAWVARVKQVGRRRHAR